MTTVSANFALHVDVAQKGADANFGGPYWNGAIDWVTSFAAGVTAGKVDFAYVTELTIASATNNDLDIAGVLTDVLGTTIAAAEVAAVIVVNKPKDPTAAANTTNITVGGATAYVPGFATAGPIIEPGGMFAHVSPGAAGMATVTATTADKIRIGNSSGASAKVQVIILMRSA